MHELTKAEALRFVAEHADLIDQVAASSNPFSNSAWLSHFIEQICEPNWSILVPHDQIDGESLMFLYASASSKSTWMALSNYYSSLFSPLVTMAGNRIKTAEKLVAQIVAAKPRCATINLSPLDAGDPDISSIGAALARRGWYLRRYFCFGNWYLPCEGVSFQSYMGQRDSKLHNTWTRKSKRFFAGSGNSVEIVSSLSEVDRAMDAYDSIYSKSWKNAEPYPNFVRAWAKVCAHRGWLRLGIASVDGVPIAAQFWFTVDRRAYIFKLAYDEDYSRWSAGTVLSAKMFEHSLDVDHVIEIDYLTGDDPYKKTWMSHRRERVGIIAHNPRTLRGLVFSIKEFAAATRARIRRQVSAGAQTGGSMAPVDGASPTD